MGVVGLWGPEEQKTLSLIEFSSDFYKKHGRPPVLAVDMLPVMYELLDGTKSVGYATFNMQFMRRVRGFTRCGIIIIGVFDGPDKLAKRRNEGKRTNNFFGYKNAIDIMKSTLTACGMRYINAQSEGEAQCAWLQSQGMVDFCFSSDADVFAFGATKLLRFAENVKAGKFRDRMVSVVEQPSKLRWSYIMCATLQGNDFNSGVDKLGAKTAQGLSQVQHLVEMFIEWYKSPNTDATEFLAALLDELHTNSSGLLPHKWNKKRTLDGNNFNKEHVSVWANPALSNYELPPAERIDDYFRRPSIGRMKHIWSSPPPFRKASDKEASKRKNTIRDTVEVIFTDLWCMHEIFMGKFYGSYYEPLAASVAKTTRFETVHLNLHNMPDLTSSMPNTIEVPIHLTQHFERKIRAVPVKASERENSATQNQRISFSRVTREDMVQQAAKNWAKVVPVPAIPEVIDMSETEIPTDEDPQASTSTTTTLPDSPPPPPPRKHVPKKNLKSVRPITSFFEPIKRKKPLEDETIRPSKRPVLIDLTASPVSSGPASN